MIWRSARNILWALVRNALQGKHQCLRLEMMRLWEGSYSYNAWVWECSCSPLATGKLETEVHAIEAFKKHVRSHRNAQKQASWYKTWGRR